MATKYALCIGNNYPGTGSELSGCVNDANDWHALLTSEGYNVEVLIEATKAEAVDRLNSLVTEAGFGDRVVFTYSGHGSWIPDTSGDEEDRRDEVLVMTDYQHGGLLVDDELQQIFSGLAVGVGALIVSDSCHSGTISRVMQAERTTATPRFLSPVNFLDMSEDEAVVREELPASQPRKTSSLISGCEDHEYSYDAWFGRRPNGAFTRAAIDAYLPGLSLAKWYQAIRLRLPSDEYPQTPQLTAKSRYRRYLAVL